MILKDGTKTKITYWLLFRPIFVMFFLYLLGDAFYRWDGFSQYASFSEFIPSLALASILWFAVATVTVLIIWIPARLIEFACRYIRINHLPIISLLYSFIILSTIIFSIKLLFCQHLRVSSVEKLAILLILAFTILAFNRFIPKWSNIVNESITPLVWLFAFFVFISIPIVMWQLFGNDEVNTKIKSSEQLSTTGSFRPNIILLTFDAMMNNDMSVYGYHRPTTPYMEKWSKSAYLFTGLQAESTYTTPAAASLMTGKRLWTHRTYHWKGTKPRRSDDQNLPSLLTNNGYYTMAFVQNEAAAAKVLGISHSFNFAPFSSEFISPHSLLGLSHIFLHTFFSDNFRLYNWLLKDDFLFKQFAMYFSRQIFKTSSPPYNAFKRFFLHTDNLNAKPFFAWIHLTPPHDPYLPPEPFIGMFDSSPALRTKQSQGKLVNGSGKVTVTDEMEGTIKTLRARYDEFIRYCDTQFEGFIKELIKRDLLANTILTVSSDHGESFDHNLLGHGTLHLYEQLTNIPLIIYEPGHSKGQIIEDTVEQIDIPATILDFANISVPKWMEGRSLRPLMIGEMLSHRPAFSMALFNNKSDQIITKGTIAVWKDDYKLIHYLDDNKSLLFDLEKDPEEHHNLFNKNQLIGQNLLMLIKENLALANKKIESKEVVP